MASSLDAHVMGMSDSPVLATPEIQYVSGETRYMKIQKPGRFWGLRYN